MAERILIADDEANLRKVLGMHLRKAGYKTQEVGDGQAALSHLEEDAFSAVITDLRMPQLDGMGLLKAIQSRWPELPVIMLTAHGTVDTAVEALKAGARDFITKPFEKDEILKVVSKAVNSERLNKDATGAAGSGADRDGRFGIIGRSESMIRIFDIVEKVAATPSTVLIQGESGTGKELIAKALHMYSDRKDKPFIKVNCAAIPDTLIESELFGYEKGAFTGAATRKPGRFELAHGGTLFLDEIGEISTEMQVKLLRAIQESEFERVGGVETVKVDVRLVAATNRDLAKEVAEGNFRDDLFYRLNVVPVQLPPLRQRHEDIPLLTVHLLKRYAKRLGRNTDRVSAGAMQVLLNYDWPGNIRELENVIERTLLFCDGPEIEAADLPAELEGRVSAAVPSTDPIPAMGVTSLKHAVKLTTQRLERKLIEHALKETNGNVTHAAQKLEISRKSLQNKMKELGLREN
ncbi:MAG: sigma-54-dependent transcriptional regulator [Bradymonadia bacterium]